MHKAAFMPENAAMLLIDHRPRHHGLDALSRHQPRRGKRAEARENRPGIGPACGVDRKHGGSDEEVLPEVFALRVMSQGPGAAALSLQFSRHR